MSDASCRPFFLCVAGALLVACASVPAFADAPATPSASPAALAPAVATDEKTDVVLIPRGFEIVVRTIQGYNSYSANTGSKMRYEVVQDAIVNGHVIARKGDTAQGAVQDAKQGDAGGFYGIGYKAANLRVSVDEIYNFCGDTIHVDFDRSEYRRRQGLFGSNKDVQVIKGQMYVPITDRVQKVCGVATAAAPLPIPSDALRRADK
jgi:opacity protein-like surface antigen